MYYALNQDTNNMDAYHGFIIDILERNNEHYRSIFSKIVHQAQELIKTHDFYAIDSERFGIVSFFAKHEDVIKELNPDDLKDQDFAKLLECIEYSCHC